MFLYRNDDLKEMLESNKESMKLDAMKRVVEVRCALCSFIFSEAISVLEPDQSESHVKSFQIK